MLIPITCAANEWTTLPPPLGLVDARRLSEASERIRLKNRDNEMRGLEPVVQVWFSSVCIFTQDTTDGYAWRPSEFVDANKVFKKMRVALVDGTVPKFWEELEWPTDDRVGEWS